MVEVSREISSDLVHLYAFGASWISDSLILVESRLRGFVDSVIESALWSEYWEIFWTLKLLILLWRQGEVQI